MAGDVTTTDPATASIRGDGNGQVQVGITVRSGGQSTAYQQAGTATLTKTADGYHSTGQVARIVEVPETYNGATGGNLVRAHDEPGTPEPFTIEVTCPSGDR
jgi:hypothetical protein